MTNRVWTFLAVFFHLSKRDDLQFRKGIQDGKEIGLSFIRGFELKQFLYSDVVFKK